MVYLWLLMLCCCGAGTGHLPRIKALSTMRLNTGATLQPLLVRRTTVLLMLHFRAFRLEAQHIPPETAGCAPYVGCVYNTSLLSVAEGSAAQAASFYYSKRFAHDFGIFNSSYMNKPPSYHNITSTLRAFQNATGQLQGGLTCANFPPSTGYTDERYALMFVQASDLVTNSPATLCL